ncbi:glycosyltransferase family A protein, partial [Staphylococcus aureus]|uniref:glycosyltransferase family A protein n=1 Tax=Staphylococcus aureus TaxID=1280 RepID=UPI0021B3F6D0
MKSLSRILTLILTISIPSAPFIFNPTHHLNPKTLNFNHKPLTIIIPPTNQQKTIPHLLHSIIQHQLPVHVIVMNDQSAHETP